MVNTTKRWSNNEIKSYLKSQIFWRLSTNPFKNKFWVNEILINIDMYHKKQRSWYNHPLTYNFVLIFQCQSFASSKYNHPLIYITVHILHYQGITSSRYNHSLTHTTVHILQCQSISSSRYNHVNYCACLTITIYPSQNINTNQSQGKYLSITYICVHIYVFFVYFIKDKYNFD